MKITFRYALRPTQAQEQTFLDYFDHLCELQNSARGNRKYAHEEEGRFVTQSEQEKLLKEARRKYDDLRAVPQDFQVSTLKRVDKAFDNFRRRCKEGAAKKGYPRFKTRVRKEQTLQQEHFGCVLGILLSVVRKHGSERDGFHFHQVDPKNTSQTCSSCGEKSPKKLSLAIRTFDCSFCGTSLDRDHNAAINILLRAETCALRGEVWDTILTETRNPLLHQACWG